MPKAKTTLDKLTEGLVLLEEAAAELEAQGRPRLGLVTTRMRVGEVIGVLTVEADAPIQTEPEVTDDG